jgi:Peptidase A4 family
VNKITTTTSTSQTSLLLFLFSASAFITLTPSAQAAVATSRQDPPALVITPPLLTTTTTTTTGAAVLSSSYNWGGYVIHGGGFVNVKGSWDVPQLACTGSEPSTNSMSSWVGIDGWGSGTVEQIGTASYCSGGSAGYYAWYEFYPQIYVTPLPSQYAISPHDTMWGRVQYSSSTNLFTLYLKDQTKGWSYQTSGTVNGGAARASAEWITEAFGFCSAPGVCTEGYLDNFYQYNWGKHYWPAFPQTDYATGGSHTGSIASFENQAGFTVYQVTMHDPYGGGGATPSILVGKGTSFYVTHITS